MPFVKDIQTFIGRREHGTDERTLILIDKSTGIAYWIGFSAPYDAAPDEDAVKQLFDSALQTIKGSHEVATSDELPIVRYVGRWKITVVVKLPNGTITIHDGTRAPISRYLGVGG